MKKVVLLLSLLVIAICFLLYVLFIKSESELTVVSVYPPLLYPWYGSGSGRSYNRIYGGYGLHGGYGGYRDGSGSHGSGSYGSGSGSHGSHSSSSSKH